MFAAGGCSVTPCFASSAGKKRSRLVTGFGAAWPRPQIEASLHDLGEALELVGVPVVAFEQAEHLLGADAAGRALAAGLVGEEGIRFFATARSRPGPRSR
jgi:hypothetical protein